MENTENNSIVPTGIKGEAGFSWLSDVMDALPEDSVFREVVSVGRGSYFTGYDDGFDAKPFVDHIYYADLAAQMGEKLKIGNFVCIAPGVRFVLGGNQNHPLTAVSQHPLFQLDPDGDWRNLQKRGDTVIGDGAWIGLHATIMPGVKIGEGARILPGAVVVRDVEPYGICGGVPAVVRKKRFSDFEIKLLTNRIRWTQWPDEVIRENVKDLLNPNPDFQKLLKISEKLEHDGLLPPLLRIGNQTTLRAFTDKQNSY